MRFSTGVFIFLLTPFVFSQEEQNDYKHAGGVFLYTPCPQSSKQTGYCAILGMRKFGEEAGSFSNPGGFIDPNEDFVTGSIRETHEETGHIFRFDKDDLERDFNNSSKNEPAFIEYTAKTDHSKLGKFKVTYRMFLKQVPPITAEDLIEGSTQGRNLHGGGETIAFALVPINDLYGYVVDGKDIIIDGTNKDLFCVDPLQTSFKIESKKDYKINLFSSFKALLQTQDGKDKYGWLKWLREKPMERDLLRKSSFTDQLKKDLHTGEESSFRRTEIAIKEGTGEQYTMIKDKESKKDKLIHREQKVLSPESLPFTATEAHLRLLLAKMKGDKKYLDPQTIPLDLAIDIFLKDLAMDGIPQNEDNSSMNHRQLMFFKKIDSSMKKQIKKVIEQEIAHKRYYVMYHALNHFNAFSMDVLTILRAEFSGNPEAINFGSIWDEGFLKQDIFTLQHLFESVRRYDYDSYKNIMMSTNPGLFFNNGVRGEYTLRYWLTDFSHTFHGGFDAIISAFRSLGISHSVREKLIKLYNKMQEQGLVPERGRLLQFFCDPAIIDKIAYVADGNRPLERAFSGTVPEKISRPSHTLYQLRQNPLKFEKVVMANATQMCEEAEDRPHTNSIQIRLLPFSDITSKDYNVTTYIYDLDDKRDKGKIETYRKTLLNFIREELAPAYKRGLNDFKFKGEKTQPKTMVEFERQSPKEVRHRPKGSTIKTWIDEGRTAEILDFVKNYDDALETVVEEYQSFLGTKASSLIVYLFETGKWDLIKAILKDISNTKFKLDHMIAISLYKTSYSNIKEILLVLSKQGINTDFYEHLVSSVLTDLEYKVEQRSDLYDLLDFMIEGVKVIKLEDVFEESLSKMMEVTLNWLIEKKNCQEMVKNKIPEFILQLRIALPNSECTSYERDKDLHDALERFLNHLRDMINQRGRDINKTLNTVTCRYKPTPESVKMLQNFYDGLDAKKFPNIAASIKLYLDDWGKK